METILEVSRVSVSYGAREIIHDISFSAQKGDFIGLVGPNGAGKTTLIKAILGLLPISSGHIKLFGKDRHIFSDTATIGYLPQNHSGINPLFPASVEEVVLLGLLSSKTFPKIIQKSDKEKIKKILETLGISHLGHTMIATLSGGQQQRVLLARTLISNPSLILFDEPSTALDPESRKDFFQLIQKINIENKVTIILITHDMGYIGAYANKLLYIDQKLIHFGPISEFRIPESTREYFEKNNEHIIWHQHH